MQFSTIISQELMRLLDEFGDIKKIPLEKISPPIKIFELNIKNRIQLTPTFENANDESQKKHFTITTPEMNYEGILTLQELFIKSAYFEGFYAKPSEGIV